MPRLFLKTLGGVASRQIDEKLYHLSRLSPSQYQLVIVPGENGNLQKSVEAAQRIYELLYQNLSNKGFYVWMSQSGVSPPSALTGKKGCSNSVNNTRDRHVNQTFVINLRNRQRIWNSFWNRNGLHLSLLSVPRLYQAQGLQAPAGGPFRQGSYFKHFFHFFIIIGGKCVSSDTQTYN